MIKASVNFMRADRPIKTSKFHGGYNQDVELVPKRNAANQVLIAGEYLGTNPMCDGDNECGCKAEYVITIRQNHFIEPIMKKSDREKKKIMEVHNGIELVIESDIENQFRNYLLLCNNCMELYKQVDVFVGEPIDLRKVFT